MKYRFVKDKELLNKISKQGDEIMSDFSRILRTKYQISAPYFLIGTGARGYIKQKNNDPIVLDYNLKVVKGINVDDCKTLRENIKIAFNEVLNKYGWGECADLKTSFITNKQKADRQTEFSIRVYILKEANNSIYWLINENLENVNDNEYKWKEVKDSNDLVEKVKVIKKAKKMLLLKEKYSLEKNDAFFSYDETTHPSFISYIKAVNKTYNELIKNDLQGHK